MAMHNHIGFLEDEESLRGVDGDFRELARLTYKIPGFGSYGVSCSGHFEYDSNKGNFRPTPWGSLQLAVIPEMPHIPELINLIHLATQEDSDAKLKLWEYIPPYKYKNFSPEVDLKNYELARTENGLYIIRLVIRLGDNGCLKPVEPYYGHSIELLGNETLFRESKKRCEQIRNFWKVLEERVRNYNQSHDFSNQDFSKKEFRPFI